MNTTIKNNLEAVKNYLNNDCDDSDLLTIHNTYSQENSSDDEIYNNDEDFFNTFFDGKVLEAVRAVCFGDYRYSDDYVMFNGYANLESFNNVSDKIDIDTLADDILENPERYDIELEDEEFKIIEIDAEGNEEEIENYLTLEEAEEQIVSLKENEENEGKTYRIEAED